MFWNGNLTGGEWMERRGGEYDENGIGTGIASS